MAGMMASDTSRDAWHHGERTGAHDRDRARVHDLIVERGSTGVTQDEVDAHFGNDSRRMGQRVPELERDGRIRKSGVRRRTRAGRWANVYVEAGRPDDEIHVPGAVFRNGKWLTERDAG